MAKGESLYAVAALVQLTGLSANTVRTWERRYRVVKPQRDSAGHRAYTFEDVERLRLLKALSQRGESIRRLAGASLAELRERLEEHGPTVAPVPPSKEPISRRAEPAVALLHGSLLDIFRSAGRTFPGRVVRHGTTLEALGRATSDEAPVDVIIADLALLAGDPAAAVARLREITGARRVVVTYDFASASIRAALERARARLVRGPLDAAKIAAAVEEAGGSRARPERTSPAPALVPRRYSDADLARLRAIESDIACECPQHLAEIVARVAAFEAYSLRCARDNPADAAVHKELHRGTAEARARLEEILGLVLLHDGISL